MPYSFSSVSTSLGNGKYQYYSYYENNTVHSFDIIASADAAYSFGDVQVYGDYRPGLFLSLRHRLAVVMSHRSRPWNAHDTDGSIMMMLFRMIMPITPL